MRNSIVTIQRFKFQHLEFTWKYPLPSALRNLASQDSGKDNKCQCPTRKGQGSQTKQLKALFVPAAAQRTELTA